MKNKILLSILFALACAYTSIAQPLLNSYSTARATIYLDFNGEVVTSPLWNNVHPLNCATSGLTATQIAEVFNRVAEDFRPFNINVTTDEAVFFAASVDRRMRVVVTPTSSWRTGVGGISFVGSFNWGDDTPCFVFCDRLGPNNPKMIAEACSHEVGHTLGLSHQSKYDNNCRLTATYNEGVGNGETSWAPIMGNSYYRNMSGWNDGPTQYGCVNKQDNLSIIIMNGFGYRFDDYSEQLSAQTSNITQSNFNIDGVISTTNDKDAFTINVSENSIIKLQALPFSIGDNNDGADLDIKVSLYDESKNLIAAYSPEHCMGVLIDTVLNKGSYYIVIDGTGNGNASDYGSLGSYTLKGSVKIIPVCTVNLIGSKTNNQHQFNWSAICNEAITNVTLQSSVDGINFSSVNSFNATQNNYAYEPTINADIYYRLQVISSSGNTAYSNILLLNRVYTSSYFTIPTFVSQSIKVKAPCGFKYSLSTTNGVLIGAGSGQEGTNSIDLSAQPTGFYIFSVFGCGIQQTTRVFKE